MNRDQLIRDYENFIWKQARKYIKHHPDMRDDIFQECCIGFLKSLDTHDETKGAIATHAAWDIRSHMSHWLKKNNRNPLQGFTKSTNDMYEGELEEITRTHHQTDHTDHSWVKERIETELSKLKPRERDILEKRCYHDMKLHEIGEQYGVTNERIRQIEDAALKKMRSQLKPALEELEN